MFRSFNFYDQDKKKDGENRQGKREWMIESNDNMIWENSNNDRFPDLLPSKKNLLKTQKSMNYSFVYGFFINSTTDKNFRTKPTSKSITRFFHYILFAKITTYK